MIVGRPIFKNVFKTPVPLADSRDPYYVYKLNGRRGNLDDKPSIGHVRYTNIQAWLRGFRVKIANFSSFFCPPIPKRDLDTKKTTPNIEV